ncbi:MAG: 2-amino-4-hydroxy-6-hydroxymethyldihydropteridine diphosphokinase [Deltaproteobacteria bacterium]|nr:2-amino-4-hydroxy-6-hydroxymethyldihydropteridine diphosphokinase [Deltaproteobacteria bacterium]
MKRVFIAVGSNIGDGLKNCRQAVDRVRRLTKVSAVSSYYKTKPWGGDSIEAQADFINGVIEIETELTAEELLKALKAIEVDMGRVKAAHWGPRVIDLDIIFYGNEIIDEDDLKVPHPYMHERGFVLVPLMDIAPEMIHPKNGKSVRELLDKLVSLEGTQEGIERVC